MTLYNTQGGDLAVSVNGGAGAIYYYTDTVSDVTLDRKRQRLEMATGNRNNTVDFYDGDTVVPWNITKVLGDTDGAVLFPLFGLGASLVAPSSALTIVYADPNRTMTVTNGICNDVEIAGERGKPWMLTANGFSTSPPARTAGYGLTRPTFQTQPNYLYWRDLLTFFTAAASGTNCTKFSIKIDHNLDPFPGVRADGYTIPIIYTPTEIYVTGTFTMQQLGFADIDLFLAACDTPGDIGITAQPFCAAPTQKVLTLTCKLGIYDTQKTTRAIKKTTLEDFVFLSKALGGVNQAVATLA